MQAKRSKSCCRRRSNDVRRSAPIPPIGESLCVLYVAMTRAVHALDMIIAPSKPNERTWPKTFAGVLRGACAPGEPAEPETTLFLHGDAAWPGTASHSAMPLPDAPLPDAPLADAPLADAPAAETVAIKLRSLDRRRRGLDYRTPSGMEGGGQVDLRWQLKLESVAALTRGSIVHAWFERIGWLEEGPPDDADLLRAAAPWTTPEVDLAQEIARFRAMLDRPTVAAALSKQPFEPAALGFARDICDELRGGNVTRTLDRERSFVVREGDTMVFGTIDRMTRYYRGGKLLAIDILDFKTDAVRDAAGIAQRAATYRPQLAAYRRAMAAVASLAPERIATRLLFVEPGVVKSIRPDDDA